eukprot:TRINITY_DN1278_c0_g1_i3.p1 TRINITY_DN1278_c0_g1~~TRINITY_DN1278_c0_g1_i3.p1  ORF type:complete len:475 (-),score=141.20 TRINITY_DN1278_c0_g1_i3:117-1499(-)
MLSIGLLVAVCVAVVDAACARGHAMNQLGDCVAASSLRFNAKSIVPGGVQDVWSIGAENTIKFEAQCSDLETCPKSIFVYFSDEERSTGVKCTDGNYQLALELIGEIDVAETDALTLTSYELKAVPTISVACDGILISARPLEMGYGKAINRDPYPADFRNRRVYWSRFSGKGSGCSTDSGRVGLCHGQCYRGQDSEKAHAATNTCPQTLKCCTYKLDHEEVPSKSFYSAWVGNSSPIEFYSPTFLHDAFDMDLAPLYVGEHVEFRFAFFPEFFECSSSVKSLDEAQFSVVMDYDESDAAPVEHVEWMTNGAALGNVLTSGGNAIVELGIPLLGTQHSRGREWAFLHVSFPGCNGGKSIASYKFKMRNSLCGPSTDGTTQFGYCKQRGACPSYAPFDLGSDLCGHLPGVNDGKGLTCCEIPRSGQSQGFRKEVSSSAPIVVIQQSAVMVLIVLSVLFVAF